MERSVLVTVGTTEFRELVEAASTEAFGRRLAELGYTSLRVQVGRGPKPDFQGTIQKLERTWFDVTPDMPGEMRKATLIISHGGAGSVMEALSFRTKPIVVCVNETLMGNHQEELAAELSQRNHIVLATPKTLCDALRRSDSFSLIPYEDFDNFSRFASLLEGERRRAIA